jgi:hypothetical protein
MSKPRKNSIVRYLGKDLFTIRKWNALIKDMPEMGAPWIHHGEVPNMPGHSVVTSLLTGKTITLHTENLAEVPPEDL